MNKQVVCLAVMLCVAFVGWSQVPRQFNYQAVVWNVNNELVANQDIEIQMHILQGSANGVSVFDLTKVVHTNSNGLFSINVGQSTSIADIDWGNGPYFIQVEPTAEYNFCILAPTRQIVSVPYAIYSEVVDSVRNFDTRERQMLSISHDTIFLTGGSFVKLPEVFDGDYNHLINKLTAISQFDNDAGYITGEVQVLSISNDTIFLTGGSFIKLPAGFDGDYNSLTNKPTIPTQTSQLINNAGYLLNEVQVLSISHDTIRLTGGSWIKLPFVPEVQTLADVVVLGNDAGYRQLKNLENPTDSQDVVTIEYIDSIFNVTNVDFGSGSNHTYEVVACDSYMWYGHSFTSTGTYTHSYANAGGYYSVDTLKLVIRQGHHDLSNVVAAGHYQWHDSTYRVSNTYTYPYYNTYGCPSVDTLQLTIIPGDPMCQTYRMEVDTATLVGCGWVNWYGAVLHQSGVYQHSLGNIAHNGCDSIVKVKVNILPSFRQDTIARTMSSITWRGHTYTEQGDYGDTLLAQNGCDSMYVLHLMIGSNEGIGAINGVFSVANGVTVRFAQGNLQYQSSANYWRFAENQYDMLGVKCMSADYSDWADMFGWATSGYHDANDTLCKHYHPWSLDITPAVSGTIADTYNQYGYGPSIDQSEQNIVGSNSNYDWGVYNPIINGGNSAGMWRTLSKNEWEYLFNGRHNATYLRSLGRIRDVESPSGVLTSVAGYILLPDNWTRPSSINFRANATSVDDNDYSLSEWQVLESTGAVFLPIGYSYYEQYNGYWTSTSGGKGGAYAFAMGSNSIVIAPYNRSNSYSIRLVQEYHAGVVDCNCTYMDTTIVTDGAFSWHGYSYTSSGDYMEAIVNAAGCDSIISLNLIMQETGVLNGNFSVSPTHTVQFSKGNLQYKPKSNIWRFADEQYGYVGDANKFRSAVYNGWIDLFSWGASGHRDSTDLWNLYYQPWVANGNVEGHGPSIQMRDINLVNASAICDWGNNPITNGGNVAGRWRTLTYEEWDYLLYKRPLASSLVGIATIHKEKGLLILPDNWSAPTGIYFDPYNPNNNVYNDFQWDRMEAAGAVFLPSAGTCYGSETVNEVGGRGSYWSATSKDVLSHGGLQTQAYSLEVSAKYNSFNLNYYENKFCNFSVRLVKD